MYASCSTPLLPNFNYRRFLYLYTFMQLMRFDFIVNMGIGLLQMRRWIYLNAQCLLVQRWNDFKMLVVLKEKSFMGLVGLYMPIEGNLQPRFVYLIGLVKVYNNLIDYMVIDLLQARCWIYVNDQWNMVQRCNVHMYRMFLNNKFFMGQNGLYVHTYGRLQRDSWHVNMWLIGSAVAFVGSFMMDYWSWVSMVGNAINQSKLQTEVQWNWVVHFGMFFKYWSSKKGIYSNIKVQLAHENTLLGLLIFWQLSWTWAADLVIQLFLGLMVFGEWSLNCFWSIVCVGFDCLDIKPVWAAASCTIIGPTVLWIWYWVHGITDSHSNSWALKTDKIYFLNRLWSRRVDLLVFLLLLVGLCIHCFFCLFGINYLGQIALVINCLSL